MNLLCKISGHEPRRDGIDWINYGIYEAVFHCKRCKQEVFRIDHTLYKDSHAFWTKDMLCGRAVFPDDEYEKIHKTWRN